MSWELLWQPARGGALVWLDPQADPDTAQLPPFLADLLAHGHPLRQRYIRVPSSYVDDDELLVDTAEIAVAVPALSLDAVATRRVLEDWPASDAADTLLFWRDTYRVIPDVLATRAVRPHWVSVDGAWVPRWELFGPDVASALDAVRPPDLVLRNGSRDSVADFLQVMADSLITEIVGRDSLVMSAAGSAVAVRAWRDWSESAARAVSGSDRPIGFRISPPTADRRS